MAKIYGKPRKMFGCPQTDLPTDRAKRLNRKNSPIHYLVFSSRSETQFLYSFNIVEGARKLNARSIEPGAVLFFFFFHDEKKNDKGPALDISYLQYQYFYDSFR